MDRVDWQATVHGVTKSQTLLSNEHLLMILTAPILWPPDAKSQLIGKDESDAGRDFGQEEKGTTEDEMAVWHH